MRRISFRRRAASGATCPYCREPLAEPARTCAGCSVLLHAECAEELGRCPTIGCGQAWPAGDGAAAAPRPQRAPAPPRPLLTAGVVAAALGAAVFGIRALEAPRPAAEEEEEATPIHVLVYGDTSSPAWEEALEELTGGAVAAVPDLLRAIAEEAGIGSRAQERGAAVLSRFAGDPDLPGALQAVLGQSASSPVERTIALAAFARLELDLPPARSDLLLSSFGERAWDDEPRLAYWLLAGQGPAGWEAFVAGAARADDAEHWPILSRLVAAADAATAPEASPGGGPAPSRGGGPVPASAEPPLPGLLSRAARADLSDMARGYAVSCLRERISDTPAALVDAVAQALTRPSAGPRLRAEAIRALAEAAPAAPADAARLLAGLVRTSEDDGEALDAGRALGRALATGSDAAIDEVAALLAEHPSYVIRRALLDAVEATHAGDPRFLEPLVSALRFEGTTGELGTFLVRVYGARALPALRERVARDDRVGRALHGPLLELAERSDAALPDVLELLTRPLAGTTRRRAVRVLAERGHLLLDRLAAWLAGAPPARASALAVVEAMGPAARPLEREVAGLLEAAAADAEARRRLLKVVAALQPRRAGTIRLLLDLALGTTDRAGAAVQEVLKAACTAETVPHFLAEVRGGPLPRARVALWTLAALEPGAVGAAEPALLAGLLESLARPELRGAAAAGLGSLGGGRPEVLAGLAAALDALEDHVRAHPRASALDEGRLREALRRQGPAALPVVAAAVREGERRWPCRLIGELDPDGAVALPALTHRALHGSEAAARDALSEIGDYRAAALPYLRQVLAEGPRHSQIGALRGLSRWSALAAPALPDVRRLVQDPKADPDVRRIADQVARIIEREAR